MSNPGKAKSSRKAASPLTHLDEQGRARMVDISGKQPTARTAIAAAVVRMGPRVLQAVASGAAPKGDVFAAARIAGIMAAKRTPELIPLCHGIALSSVTVDFIPDADRGEIAIHARATTMDRTGVEMEAMAAAAVAALTLYDMVKGMDKSVEIASVRLLHKDGGKSGVYQRRT
ncbi:MAG: Cyclic pyranopterin monophosphate synthase 2 [Myxococcota bacterium]|nr:Cyclic pyranopterin monophosphate synthase 2 [Myxococcota bacterium]